MSAALVAIADAVQAAFASGYGADPRRVSQDIHVERGYVPEWKLDQLDDWDHAAPVANQIRVYVATETEELNAADSTRDTLVYDYTVQVAIAAKPKTTHPAEVDPLLLLTQELRDYFFHQDRTAYALPGHSETASNIETLAHPDLGRLSQDRIFHAGFLLTFQGERSR